MPVPGYTRRNKMSRWEERGREGGGGVLHFLLLSFLVFETLNKARATSVGDGALLFLVLGPEGSQSPSTSTQSTGHDVVCILFHFVLFLRYWFSTGREEVGHFHTRKKKKYVNHGTKTAARAGVRRRTPTRYTEQYNNCMTYYCVAYLLSHPPRPPSPPPSDRLIN